MIIELLRYFLGSGLQMASLQLQDHDPHDPHEHESAHDHDHHGHTALIIKIVVIVAIPIISLISSLLPFFFSFCMKKGKAGRVIHALLDIGQGFAAGILVGGAVLHIFPEVSQSMTENIKELGGSERLAIYPFPGLIAISTFTFIYFSEFFLGKLFEYVAHKKHDQKLKNQEHIIGVPNHEPSTSERSEDSNPNFDTPDNNPDDNSKAHDVDKYNEIQPEYHFQNVKALHGEISVPISDVPQTESFTNENISNSNDKYSYSETCPTVSDSIFNPIQESCKEKECRDAMEFRSMQNDADNCEDPQIFVEVKESKEKENEVCPAHTRKHIHDHHGHHFDLLVDHHASLTQIITRGFILWLSLSLHSFLEGLGLGSQTEISTIATLLTAILLHKVFEAFALGDVLQMGLKKKQAIGAIFLLVLYSTTTSVGTLIGMGVNMIANSWFGLISNILLCIAIGALLHVGLFELLFHHTISESPIFITIPYLFLYIVGVGGVAILGIFVDHSSHNH